MAGAAVGVRLVYPLKWTVVEWLISEILFHGRQKNGKKTVGDQNEDGCRCAGYKDQFLLLLYRPSHTTVAAHFLEGTMRPGLDPHPMATRFFPRSVRYRLPVLITPVLISKTSERFKLGRAVLLFCLLTGKWFHVSDVNLSLNPTQVKKMSSSRSSRTVPQPDLSSGLPQIRPLPPFRTRDMELSSNDVTASPTDSLSRFVGPMEMAVVIVDVNPL